MKILLLSNCNNPHTIKWATSLVEKGLDIAVFSLNKCKVTDYEKYPAINIYDNTLQITRNEGALSKIKYLKVLPELKKIIKEYQPDILHVHYASSYGILGALCNFSPFILSVWGTDVFSFPKKSFIHKSILKYNFKKANKILSTSHVMKKETNLYTSKKIEVTPFGIDTSKFELRKGETLFNKDDIVIGTIKTLEEVYGIEYLIRAFKVVSDKHKNLPLKLLIVGGGSLDKSLKKLTNELKIAEKVIFTGNIPFTKVPVYHNMLSIAVFLSFAESFGVAVIESSACEKPVVVSNVGGLPEVVEDGVTGIIVPVKNVDKTVKALEKLLFNKELQQKMGKAGRERVKKLYDWEQNVKQMIGIYKKELEKKQL